MKYFGAVVLFLVWCLRLVMGAIAFSAIVRLWPERGLNLFVRYTRIHLHAVVIDAVFAITVLFIVSDLKLTWKFNIMWAISIVAQEATRLPLLLYILKGPEPSGK